MSSSVFRRKMKKTCSILDKLNCRSASGLDLGLDVHQHPYNMIILFWNTHNITGCYLNFIVRHAVDGHVQYQLNKLFKRGGPVGACECCFPIVNLSGVDGKACIYFSSGCESIRHSMENWHAKRWDFRTFTCWCPEVNLSPKVQNLMIICCLRNSNLTLINPTFGNLRKYRKKRVLTSMMYFGMHEA
jgi:hypothetical protein